MFSSVRRLMEQTFFLVQSIHGRSPAASLLLRVLNVTPSPHSRDGRRGGEFQETAKGLNYSSKPALPAILISSAELLKLSFL